MVKNSPSFEGEFFLNCFNIPFYPKNISIIEFFVGNVK